MGTILEKTVAGVTTYKHPNADAYEIEFRAKTNCRHCYGRGRVKFSRLIRQGLAETHEEEWTEVCSCVNRKK